MGRVSFDQLFIPKDGLMECLKTVGAVPGPLSLAQVMDHMKQYIMERQLIDAKLPPAIVCGQDPLGKVLGVERFLVSEAMDDGKNEKNDVLKNNSADDPALLPIVCIFFSANIICAALDTKFCQIDLYLKKDRRNCLLNLVS